MIEQVLTKWEKWALSVEQSERNADLVDALAEIREAMAQQSQDAKLREAVEALLSNEEHAVSSGMRSYQVGSPTWKIWKAVRQAMQGGQK